MKVYIGPYSRDLIPVRNWERRYEFFRSKSYEHKEEDKTWFDKVIYKVLQKLDDLCRPINRWSNNRERKIEVRVDGYDAWNADSTLAYIIHPVLLKLRDDNHGSPFVDPIDVPEHLRPKDKPDDSNGYIDSTHHERWTWVLDEMIWAFEHINKDDDQFYHNIDQLEMVFTHTEKGYSTLDFNYQKDPAKPKYWVDEEAKTVYYDRISNGLRLFGKYYRSLWD